MECKLLIKSGLETNKCELIDTLWNVNKTIKYYRQEGFYELIDTLWNVNEDEKKEITQEEMN